MSHLICIIEICFLTALGCAQENEVIQRAMEDVGYLTSAHLMGRGYQYEGHKRAAAYIKVELERIDILPLNGSYFQEFEVRVNSLTSVPFLQVNGELLNLGSEFIPDASSASGKAADDRQVVFVNHGLHIPTRGIDEFRGKSTDHAIVIMNQEVPEDLKKDYSIPQSYFYSSTRIDFITQHHPKAIILTTDKLIYEASSERLPVPVFKVLRQAFPEQVEKISYHIDTKIEEYTSQNVMGYLEGTVYPDSIVMLCAHYDHLGALSSEVFFPGANDNASGVSLVLNLARFFREDPLKYSLLFIFFSGEEAGLVGSKYFSTHPLIDLSKIKFLLNFDMVASGEDGLVAVGGKHYLDDFKKLEEVAISLGLGKIISRKNSPNSDHYHFLEQGVKGFFIYPRNGKQPYHSIWDRMETLEWEDYLQIYQLAKEFIKRF